MSMSLSFHDVEKIVISNAQVINSEKTGTFSSREIVIRMKDGKEITFDVYADNETLPLEIN